MPLVKTSPVAVLVRAAQAKKSGLFVLEADPQARVFLQAGRLAQIEGVPVLKDVADGAGSSGNLLQDQMAVCQTGVPFDDAKDLAAAGFGKWIAQNAENQAACSFQEGVTPPPGSFPLDQSVTRIVANGFKKYRAADGVARQLGEHLGGALLPQPLSLEDRSGLGPKVLRVHALCKGRTLTQLVQKAMPKGPQVLEMVWQSLDLLLHLGLVQVEGLHGAQKPLSSAEEAAAQKREAEAVAQQEAEDAEKVAELEARLIEVTDMRPLDALEVQPDAKLKLDAAGVDRVFRKIAATYHPDNYPSGAQRDAAARVFAVLHEKREEAQKPEVLAEEVDRLIALGEGRRWVPEANRKQARVLFGQVTRLEEAKQWKDARKKLGRVLKLDDSQAIYHVLRLWLDVILKELEPLDAIQQLDELSLKTVPDKVEGNYRAGRILKLANKTKLAYARFQRVLEMVPNHVGAKREVRLIERRANQSK